MNKLLVGDAMSRELLAFRPETYLDVAAREMLRAHVSGGPVLDSEGRVIGVLSLTDVVRCYVEGVKFGTYFYGDRALAPDEELLGELDPEEAAPGDETVGDAMTPLALTVFDDVPLAAAARQMLERGVHRLLVCDREGRLIGIVTAMDVVRCMSADYQGHPVEVMIHSRKDAQHTVLRPDV